MNPEKFKKPQFKVYNTPEDAYDRLFNPEDFLPVDDDIVFSVKGRDIMMNKNVLFRYNADNNNYTCIYPQFKDWNAFQDGGTYRPCQLLLGIKFKGDYQKARQFILYEYLDADVPYIRVASKYFKVVKRKNQYGIDVEDIVVWGKDAISDDYGKPFLKRVHKFDDFTVEPCNIGYKNIIDGQYNLYKPFPHKPHPEPVSITDIPTISGLIHHIFGEQQELGYRYYKILYEYPKQILPVLCLISEERQTGKTTLLNFTQMLFGANFGIINSETLTSAFNSAYAYLNIIGVDETVIEKASAVEKIKMLATASTLNVNMKNINEFNIPFYGKIMMATNKEKDFMRIDTEEIRFWLRKPGTVKRVDPKLNQKFIAEIPKFLRYLHQLDDIEFGKSRMVFTPEEIRNTNLDIVKRESWSGLRKELYLLIQDIFIKDKDKHEIELAVIDIKQFWFENDSRVSRSYIKKVIEDEMKYNKSDKIKRYNPPVYYGDSTKTGTPYIFKRKDFEVPLEDKQHETNRKIADIDPRNDGSIPF
jgi:hypothetical protein